MRRRSDKAATKKAKASPEKKEKEKPEKLKRTRSRRRKQSSSSENESVEESVSKQTIEVSEPVTEIAPVVAKEESPEQSQEQVWHVKAADTSGDGGEIQKLKICLTRPPSTPERVDRSPRSKRKHSRATSSSDTPSVESEEKKKPKHRTRRFTAEAKDSLEKSSTVQSDEMENESQAQPSTKSDSDISQSNESKDTKEITSYETPMSTTNDDKEEKMDTSDTVKSESLDQDKDAQDKISDADTTVASPKQQEEVPASPEMKSPMRKRSSSVEKSEVLELHAEDSRCESSDFNEPQEEDSKDIIQISVKPKDEEITEDSTKVSINEAENEVSGKTESTAEVQSTDTKNDVVEVSKEETKLESVNTQEMSSAEAMEVEDNKQNTSVESNEDSSNAGKPSNIQETEENKIEQKNKEEIQKDIEVAKPSEEIANGQATSIVINRKRRWGSRPSKLTTQKSLTISTDILKEIIPDVKPAEFEEVIEERKHKRIEIPERIERPVLPKIVIDNTENVERNKKDSDEKENSGEKKTSDSHLASSRKISIVKDNDSIIARPPSPPRHKQSNILFITNLVRPFTLPQLKNLLQRTGRITENGFWIDRIKSKCFVIYENEDQAVETRHALHGVTWPVSNPKTLQVDFSTQEEFDKAKANEDTDNAKASTIPGTVEDWLREQDMKREKGEIVTDRPWERKVATREWDLGKNDKNKEKEKFQREERPQEKRRHRSPERSPEPARKFKKKEEEAPAKLLDDLFRKTKTTPCIYWLPLSAETIAVKEEQRRQHMAEYERRMQENRRPHRRHYWVFGASVWHCWHAPQPKIRLLSKNSSLDNSPRQDSQGDGFLGFLNTSNPILSADRQYILAPSEVESITSDGIPGVIYNGHTDWVYEEDVMYTGQATWFSPDGKYLAFASFNDTLVETYSYYYYEDKSDPEDLYPELVDLKYPKVGRINPTVTLRVVDLSTIQNNVNYIVMEAPEEVSDDHILGGVTWPTETEIAAHWLNRRQNQTVLRICNIQTLVCENEHREQPNGWVPIALPRFSSKGDYYVSTRWSLQQADGKVWQHLYVTMRVNGTFVSSSVTPGARTINSFVGLDEENLAFYYTSTVEGRPWQSGVHIAGSRIGCLSCDIKLPDNGACTWATATASHRGSYLTITCSSTNEPSATYIYHPLNRTILYTWETNEIVRERLKSKVKPNTFITTVPLQNGHPAPVRLFLPPGLDQSDTQTKYPLVYYVYSGPNTNTVFDTFTVGYHSYLATSRNTIYMLADGRGAGLNGQDILYSLNNALGTVEVEDHSVILKQVLSRYGYIDPQRVGIWGHSYGGYATLLTLLHDDEHLFKCGVSGAPVTSWLYYNTMYTERYMGLPTAEDNLAGYERGDVTLLAEKLRGHDFYLMHGNADDNVHYQNAAKLMKALQELNIPFEQMSYPDEAHSLRGVNMHRYNTMNRYWEKCIQVPGEVGA
ncbi:apoptotic chromatin condensation inducer in the nucleus-like [Zerene cesonia]|uniref:apoptotic chromatin condensation inducer in the nucleus-like n=1 Tax=Zerene cesonia TaxID=33412 RepID=UPI0018E56BFC|nr:apoptotic chromatin condensation inducer in the nucleus-like [Zerene cesonia]